MAGGQTDSNTHFYKLEPRITEVLALEMQPRERIVQCYIATRAAQRTLSRLSEHYDSGAGDLFWLVDGRGAGKTHFLNYFLALRQRLAKAAHNHRREVVLAFDYAASASAANLEHDILTALAKELGGNHRGVPLWRAMGAAAAFEVALGEARRAAVGAITMVIDLGPNPAPAFADDLVRLARAARRPSVVVIAAGGDNPPAGAALAEVGTEGMAELISVAIGRVRRLETRPAALLDLYETIDLGQFTPNDILPFHAETLRTLAALLPSPATIAEVAQSAREVLAAHKDTASLVLPYELFDVPELHRIITNRLGVDGREALRSAASAVQSVPRPRRHLAERIVRTLTLAYLCGEAPALELNQLWGRVIAPPDHSRADNSRITAPERTKILKHLYARSAGAITASSVGAALVPMRQASPDIELFNHALALLKLFDPGIDGVENQAGLAAALARLSRCLSNLTEEADAVIHGLNRYALACNTQLEPEIKRTIGGFIELAHRGAQGLVELGVDQQRAADARALVAGYREMAAAAACVAPLLSMKKYLEQTRLVPGNFDPGLAPELASLAAERGLLEAELGPRAPYSRVRDSLQARIEKFRWTYTEQYRIGHERWRAEMVKASALMLDVEAGHQTLLRLDSIGALGGPQGDRFSEQVRQARDGLRVCAIEGGFNTVAAPICPQCRFVLGSTPPGDAIARLLEPIKRALQEKFTALSRGTIARLIKKYDHAHRLDGFLKITQAAQAQALAAVMDDQLTAYLARLLKENPV